MVRVFKLIGIKAAVLMLIGAAGTVRLLTMAWGWYLRYEIERDSAISQFDAVIPSPGIPVTVLAAAVVLGITYAVVKSAVLSDNRNRIVRRLTGSLLFFAAASLGDVAAGSMAEPVEKWISCHAGVSSGLFYWQAVMPLLTVLLLTAASVAAAVTLKDRISRLLDRDVSMKKLFFIFFLIVHIPSFWFAMPWASHIQRQHHIGGDEPRYLQLTHSLAKDFDVNIYNNLTHHHRNRYISPSNPYRDPGDAHYAERAREKWNADAPHSTAEYWKERRYGIERPGMPLLLAPAYRAGLEVKKRNRYGAVTMLNIILAFSMINIFLFVKQITGNSKAGVFAALTAGLSAPLLYYGVSAYTEPAASALLLYCFRKCHWFSLKRSASERISLLHHCLFALALAYLPWIHEKMIGFSIITLAVYIFSARPNLKASAVVAFFLLVTILLQARYYWVLYGQCMPPYVHRETFEMNFLFQRGLWGIFFDQKRGAIVHAPWMVAGILGLIMWMKRGRSVIAAAVLFILVLFIGITGSFKGWYGGACPQPRYIANVFPFFAVGLGVAWYYCRGTAFRYTVASLAVIGVVQGVSTLLVRDFISIHRGPVLRDIFPCIFEMSLGRFMETVPGVQKWVWNIEQPFGWVCLIGWLVLVLWSVTFLRAERRSPAVNIIPFAALVAIMLGAPAVRRPVADVIRGDEEIKELVSRDSSLNTFNSRVKLISWLSMLGHDVEGVPEFGGDASIKLTDAEGNDKEQRIWKGSADNLRIAFQQTLSLYKGKYRVSFRLLRPEGGITSDSRIILRARCGDQILSERTIALAQISDQWGNYSLPLELSDTTRGIYLSITAQGDGTLKMSKVTLVRLPEK